MELIIKSTLAAASLGLAACSGGTGNGPGMSGGPDIDNTVAFDSNSTAQSEVTFAALDPEGALSDGLTVYARDGDTMTGSALAGTYDPATGIVTLDDGGMATLTQTGDFSGTILLETTDGTAFGTFGVRASDAPTTGTATYTGTTELTIVDGSSLYEVSGDMTAFADFDDEGFDVVLDNLDGTQTDGFGVPQGTVEDLAVVEIGAAEINGGAIQGGIPGFDSDTIAVDLSDFNELTHEGNFYGPGYDEVGGSLVIDDSDAGSLLIFGTYTGD